VGQEELLFLPAAFEPGDLHLTLFVQSPLVIEKDGLVRQVFTEDWAGTVTFDGQSLRAEQLHRFREALGFREALEPDLGALGRFLTKGQDTLEYEDSFREPECLSGSVALNQEPFETLKIGHG
jgi:hypothetical protein